MLGDVNVHATVAVKDLAAAKSFYEGTLGLALEDENPGGLLYRSGATKVMVYQSDYAGTNQATSASWEVADVESTVAGLRDKGVTFEQYDGIPGVTREGDVHVMGNMKSAWFKDPDGNILCVASG